MNENQEDKTFEGVVNEEPFVATESAQWSVVHEPTLTLSAPDTSAPDAYAVGIHVLKMAPAWLLTIAVSFILLILALSWLRPSANALGKAYSNPNDSKAPAVLSAPPAPKGEQRVAEVKPVADSVSDKAAPSEAPAPVEPASTLSTSPAETPPSVVVNSEKSSMTGAAEKQANAAVGSELKFTVQVGSHTNESGANEQVSRLRAAGFDARTVAVELPGRGKWFRVQAGSFNDRAGASKDAAMLRAKGIAHAAIVVPQQ